MPLWRPGLIRGIKTSVPVSNIQDCQSYLDHCRFNEASIESTIFRGTFYELVTKKFLQNQLNCNSLVRAGGAYDNGVDIYGKWDLSKYWNHAVSKISEKEKLLISPRMFEKSTKPILRISREFYEHFTRVKQPKHQISLKLDIDILVQCKNHDTKIPALVVREMIGVYHYHVTKKEELRRTIMFLISPKPLTPQGVRQVDTAQIPIVHCTLTPLLPYLTKKNDIYDLENWGGGILETVYMNGVSRSLLQGLQIESQMELLKAHSKRKSIIH